MLHVKFQHLRPCGPKIRNKDLVFLSSCITNTLTIVNAIIK